MLVNRCTVNVYFVLAHLLCMRGVRRIHKEGREGVTDGDVAGVEGTELSTVLPT